MPRKKRDKTIQYSPEIVEKICGYLESGQNLTEMCRKHSDELPPPYTIHRWKRLHPDFYSQYKIARQTLFELRLDELDNLSREPIPDTGEYRRDSALLKVRDQRIRALQFQISQIATKIIPEYSNRVELLGGGKDGVQFEIVSWNGGAKNKNTDISNNK